MFDTGVECDRFRDNWMLNSIDNDTFCSVCLQWIFNLEIFYKLFIKVSIVLTELVVLYNLAVPKSRKTRFRGVYN